jgi:branched-subunit amino acid transport protein
MYWVLLILMAVIVFVSRYLFLEPKLPLRLNDEVLRFLSYSAPAVLAAVIGPLVLLDNGELNLDPANPYLLGAISAVLLMLITKNTLLTAVASMTLFFVIN